MDAQTILYLRYYSAQSGGNLVTYNGPRRGQYGGGLGDILRGIWRTIFPIGAKAAGTFLSESVKGRDSGKGWGESLKSAIAPTVQGAAADAVDKLASAASQGGSGRHRPYNLRRRNKRRHAATNAENDGQSGGRHRAKRRDYKRPHATVRGNRPHASKRIKFLNF